jgi:hypothetical protein
MRITTTHNQHDTTPARVLFMAFELSEKSWKLGFTTGHGQKPRERGVAARHQARVLQEIAQAKKRFARRLGAQHGVTGARTRQPR